MLSEVSFQYFGPLVYYCLQHMCTERTHKKKVKHCRLSKCSSDLGKLLRTKRREYNIFQWAISLHRSLELLKGNFPITISIHQIKNLIQFPGFYDIWGKAFFWQRLQRENQLVSWWFFLLFLSFMWSQIKKSETRKREEMLLWAWKLLLPWLCIQIYPRRTSM